ncbi:hypothetical protein [Hymenobacter arizonensis]|uniref:Beta-lactamase-inhibitor-like, PepSY-like n=1 Tax=Hymenobacter arizonensis TaxID=1227077 RepID=A0A1I5U0S6_HYMAR|nr:hypothetical protein [Hymenobacter arizonensis]SFP88910.1 hypothetical protein SAMN04515668_0706 [Hymenobacter arizonensis]
MRSFPKSLLVLAAALGPGLAAQAQVMPSAHVPPLPFMALQQRYPLARNVKWKRTQGWYQASYTQNQAHLLVRFDRNGAVQATGYDVASDALPLPVQRALAERFADRKICQAAAITNAYTQVLTYEMATCESHISYTIILTPSGARVPRVRRKG